MRRLVAAALLLPCLASAALAGCAVDQIEKALTASLDGLKKTERNVSDVQSTEGGLWRIYRSKGDRLANLVRIDGGESGMGERRLAVVSPDLYGIAVTRVDYLRHAFIDAGGPNGTARRTTEYFYFCAGRLYVPPAEYATLDGAEYAKAGEAARKAMLDDKDVADATKALKR